VTATELYTATLMLRAVEACRAQSRGLHIWADTTPGAADRAGRWSIHVSPVHEDAFDDEHVATTLPDALTSLLYGLGADVPEWPSEERVREMASISLHHIADLRNLFRREPLTVIALLAEDAR